MNRRSFLSSAAGAGAVAALPFAAVTKVHSQSSGPNPSFLTLVNSAIAVQGTAVVNLLNGKSSASDWTNSANALMAVYNSWMANNVDGQLASAFQKLNTGEITLANLATQSLAQAILTYMPSFPVSGWYSLMQAAFPSFEPYIPVVLAYIQEYGFADFIALEAAVYQAIGQGGGMGGAIASPNLNHGAARALAAMPQVGRMEPANSPCGRVGHELFYVGLAFTVVGVMSGLGVFEFAAWGAISVWGGLGATAGGAAFEMGC